MKFNGGNFELRRFGQNTELQENGVYFTPNQEDIIEEKESLRDLGVIISNDMTFSNHVDKVCSKVSKKARWMLRTFRSRKTCFLKLLFKSPRWLLYSIVFSIHPKGYAEDWESTEKLPEQNYRSEPSRLLGKAFLSKDELPREEDGEVPYYLYLENSWK